MKGLNAYAANIAAMLIFGSVGIFVQAIPLRSSEIVAARTILGSLFLCGMFVLLRRKPDFVQVKRHLGILVISGIVMGANWMFLFCAYQYTSVSVATLLYYCAPVLVLFLTPFFLREKLTRSKIAGIALAVIGMVLVNGTQTGGANPQRGMVYGLLAAVFLQEKLTMVQVLGAVFILSGSVLGEKYGG